MTLYICSPIRYNVVYHFMKAAVMRLRRKEEQICLDLEREMSGLTSAQQIH